MAHIATNSASNLSLGKLLAAPFVAFGNAVVKLSEASSRAQLVEKLQNMSDAELAERGITRDQIVHHVFRDYMYL